jgi:pyrimidine operon attenuation protein / uracil phosphoribosyltransferase
METTQTKNGVLDKESVNRKMKRIALEIAEQNIEETGLVIAGIKGNGEVVARHLVKELQKLVSFPIEEISLLLNKKDPLEVKFDHNIDLDNKVVILVDDVANTGKTMLYAMKPLLNGQPKKIQTMVLVERSHKLFPIQTDYTGLSITTTLQEHIVVETENDNITGAFLY